MSLPRPSSSSILPDETSLVSLCNELQWKLDGEVRFDETARTLYATDASAYEIKPYGVVLPKSRKDVEHTLEIAGRYRVPVLPRGGGTSLAGQTVGRALIIDFSKYMDRILEFDPEARTVKVEPGVVRDNLNFILKDYALQFTPDVSTTSRANIGGMVANNSAGTRSIKYGKTVDQVVAMTVLLSDGTVTELRTLSPEELAAKKRQRDLEGEVYRTVHRVVTEHEAEIEARFPKVMRRVGGYNLDEFTGGRAFNLAKLVAGSEGTLALILDVTLKLESLPSHRALALLHFETLENALTAVQHINRHGPSAVEILDDNLFELGRANPNLEPLLGWLCGEPAAVLMVEFDGASEAEIASQLDRLRADPEVADLCYHSHVAADPEAQEEVWAFRRGGLGIYATVKGDVKPVAFIEDSAIPVEHLPKYIPEVLDLCRSYGVKAVIYAHASVGVIHIRPHLNLKTPRGVELYEKISRDVFELVRRYGGSWSGEHGDGLVRSYQNKKLFGELLYQDFKAIKRAFDPANLINPGKIVDAPAMTENLRYGPEYRAQSVDTHFSFAADGGFLGAVEMCTGVGHCRKTTTGTMCPSFMATRDEDHSTRGRANLLRDAINGRMPGGLTSQAVYEAMDLCLECKACKSECPSRVDMAKLKYEFLQQYYDAHGTPMAARALGNAARAAPLGQVFAPVANSLLRLEPVRWLMERTVGIDKRRVMPAYAHRSFKQWMKARQKREGPRPGSATSGKKVALFADTWTMYNEPEVGAAAIGVLEACGFEVEPVPYRCCGRPQISKGLLREAKALASRNVEALYPYVEQSIPIVGLEPSCVTAFQDDYRDLVPGDETEKLAGEVKMIDQFLAKAWTSGDLQPEAVFDKTDAPIMLHGHCQQRAILGTGSTKAVLNWLSDDVSEVDSGCCGMAGSFGYGHYDISMQIGEQRLFPAVRQHRGETVACGFSCRHQIADGTGRDSKHVVELMAERLKTARER